MEQIIIKKAILKYDILDDIVILDIKGSDKEKERLLNRLIIHTFYLRKNIINQSGIDLSMYHFTNNLLDKNSYHIKSFVNIGDFKKGEKNNICDVKGVSVGSATIDKGLYHTGLTIIKPHPGNIFKDKVVASSFVFNGFGKSIGLLQIDELGTIESPIVFSSTLNIGKVCDALVSDVLKENAEIGESTGTFNPVVLECNDGTLSKSRDRVVGEKEYQEAKKSLSDFFLQGNVGAGCGMICHGFKGGLGSASRVIDIQGKTYTIGVILNSNFGTSHGDDLIIKGIRFKNLLNQKYEGNIDEKGSVVACVATDAPLNERQLKRVLKRVEMGIARTGSYAGNGSGDVFVAFSTANKRKHFVKEHLDDNVYFNDNYINPIFKAVIEASEEAVLNSMFFSTSLKGYKQDVVTLAKYLKDLDNIIDEEIIWK